MRELAAALRAVTKGMSGATVLDFGSGSSPYRALFADFEKYVTADLPNQNAALTINDGLVPADDGMFDVVLSTQVLEHVSDPAAYLAEAHRLLAPTGKLVLSTHGIYKYHPAPEDFWRWTGPGLRRQIEGCGLRVLEIVPVVSAPAAALTMAFQYAATLFPRPLEPVWHFVTQFIVQFVDSLSVFSPNADDAACFVILAERA